MPFCGGRTTLSPGFFLLRIGLRKFQSKHEPNNNKTSISKFPLRHSIRSPFNHLIISIACSQLKKSPRKDLRDAFGRSFRPRTRSHEGPPFAHAKGSSTMQRGWPRGGEGQGRYQTTAKYRACKVEGEPRGLLMFSLN